MKMNDKTLKTIEVFSGTKWEAEMVRTLLANAEIMSFVKNDILSINMYDPKYSDGVKVIISVKDYEEAKDIVQAYYDNL